MPNLLSIMTELKSKGSEPARKTYARHGMAKERTIGVSVADLKVVAKTLRGNQQLAYELYGTGLMEAMYLAGLVADGSKMTREQLHAWAQGARDLRMITEYTVPWVVVESPFARELALEWIGSPDEHLAACGWRVYAGLLAIKPDAELEIKEVADLLDKASKGVHAGPDRVRYVMNGFVITAGSYVKPLHELASAAAAKMGTVSIDMGDTDCRVPVATAAIEKVSSAGKLGKKRKTLRC